MSEKDLARLFSENLKKRRKELGLTQKELGRRIGYSEKAISKWEIGVCIAPSATLPILAEALHTSIDSLLQKGSSPKYFLGIDGGGTKTEFVLADSLGKVVSRTVLGSSNPVDIGIGATLKILDEGISTVCSGVSFSNISAFAGISGGITGDYKQQIASFLEKYRFANVNNGSDSENALAAALDGKDGIMIISGTGAIAYVQKSGRARRIGGFGYLFEKGGSGFSLGQAAIRTALSKEDGSIQEDTLILDMVRAKCGSDNVLSRLADFYSSGKRGIASYATVIFEASDKGDRIAKEILKQNAFYISENIEIAARQLDAKIIPTVIVGGLTARADVLLPLIKEGLSNKARFDLSVYSGPPVYGALRLAGMPEQTEWRR